MNKKEGNKKLEFFQENGPSTLDVPRNLHEEHTLVAVKQNGEYKTVTIATNFPEGHQYDGNLLDSAAKHCSDFLNFKSDWASISEAQMRLFYRNSSRQKQQEQHSENSQAHVEEKPKNERQIQQYMHPQPQPPIVLNGYDAVGRNFHYGSIGLGVVAWFLTFASIWWLNNENRKRENR